MYKVYNATHFIVQIFVLFIVAITSRSTSITAVYVAADASLLNRTQSCHNVMRNQTDY